jgi:hypothetical protein
METNNTYIKCDCGGDLLEIERYKDDPQDKGFYIAFWSHGHWSHAPMSWKERIRWCWKVLKTGCPWNDMVVIDDEKALDIATFLLKNAEPEIK